MRGRRLTLFCLAAFMALAGIVSRNAFAEDEAEGRRHYRRGESLVQEERYRDAIAAFEKGHAASPRPGFLLNIANCYRKLGELGASRTYYWKFLDSAPKDHPARAEVIEYLRSIEQIAADGVSLDPVEARRAHGAVPRAMASPAPEGTVGLVDQAKPEDASSSGTATRWYVWAGVGAVLIGAGVTAFLLSRGEPSPSCPGTLGCFRE